MGLNDNAVLCWYNDALLSIQLSKSFIEGVENQATDSFTQYEKNKQTHFLEECSEENYSKEVETHQGLDDGTFDLPTMFREYLPSLYRRSALLTIYAFFEHELDRLCKIYKAVKKYELSPSDLRDRGIDQSISYLKKIAGINVYETSSQWKEIKSIQRIRNLIAHQNGKLNGEKSKSLQPYINGMDCLSELYGEVMLNNGFLNHTVAQFQQYFQLINQSIQKDREGLKRY